MSSVSYGIQCHAFSVLSRLASHTPRAPSGPRPARRPVGHGGVAHRLDGGVVDPQGEDASPEGTPTPDDNYGIARLTPPDDNYGAVRTVLTGAWWTSWGKTPSSKAP